MKKLVLVAAMLMVFGMVTMAQATLFVRGRDTAGNQLIYDNDLNITWYDYTNIPSMPPWNDNTNVPTTWQDQLNWATNLSVTLNGVIYDDWRLPNTIGGPLTFGYDGTTTTGYNITSSEFGHLYYTELGNPNWYGYGWHYGLQKTGDFEHLRINWYWSGTEAGADGAYYFYFGDGFQVVDPKSDPNGHAIAVFDGDVAGTPVPEPTSILLFGSGLVGFAGYFRKKFKQN